MKTTLIALAIAAVCVAAIVPPGRGAVTAAAPKAADDFQLVKVADGIFAGIAKPGGLASGNAGFVIGDGAVLVFDTFFTPTAMEELIGEIQAQTNLPIKYAVNSHYHLDHTGGNQVLLARGVTIIGHDKLTEWQTTKNKRFLPAIEELQKRRADAAKQLAETPAAQADKRATLQRQIRRLDEMQNIKLTNPNMTFSVGTLHLYLGKREVILFSMPGHTGGDLLAYVPDANVVFTGDLGWCKTLPNLVDATVSDWIPTLESLLDSHPKAKFVPGHGNVAEAADIQEFKEYLEDLRQRVSQAIADEVSLEKAREQLALPERYKAFAFQNFVKPNIDDMYKELTGEKEPKSPDLQ